MDSLNQTDTYAIRCIWVLFLSILKCFTFFLFIMASASSLGQVVKLSNSKICHDSQSPFYDRVKRFERFHSIDECLAAGGRLPHIDTPPADNSPARGSYSRDAFGHGWADTNKDCQNTRHEVLIQQSSTKPTLSKNGCKAEHGRWVSLFTGMVITDAKQLDIDHVVPLKWAWEHGANQWPNHKRVLFANDPVNLIAVEAPLNRAKGAKGPDEWLPPKNECQYILRFKRILTKYALRTPNNIEAMVADCMKK